MTSTEQQPAAKDEKKRNGVGQTPVALTEMLLLTQDQAAALCSVSPDTFIQWVRERKLPRGRMNPGHKGQRWTYKQLKDHLEA